MRKSFVESWVNICAGFLISWVMTWAVLGYTPAQSVGVVAMFTVTSFARLFLVREAFRRFWE